MDENTKIIKDGLGAVAKQNRETNHLLREANQRTTLKKSIDDNKGEILVTAAMGALESKVDKSIAKGHNLGVGVMAKAGVDIVPGGEPAVDEKETLYGITKEFYGRFNFGNLLGLTKQNLKTNDKVLEGFQSLNKSTEKNSDEQLTYFEKLTKFFEKMSEEGEGFRGGIRQGFGVPQLGKKMSEILKSFKSFPIKAGLTVAKGIKLPILVIASGLKKLGSILLKPLTSIVKGIASLPGKILGFFGGAFSLIGRLALLGGGIFALSKLTDYLRGVGPGGQESFTDMLMLAFDKVKLVLLLLKDTIVDVVIPALGALASALVGMVETLAKLGLLPGVTMYQGRAKEAEKSIRENLSKAFPGADPEKLEKLIQKEIERQRKMRLEEYKGVDYTLAGIPIGPLIRKRQRLFEQGDLAGAMRVDKEIDKLIATQEESKLVIGGEEFKIKSFDKIISDFKKDMRVIEEKRTGGMIGSGNNAVAIDAKNITNYSASDKRVLMSADPFNISNP